MPCYADSEHAGGEYAESDRAGGEYAESDHADGDYAGFVKRRHEQVPMGKMGESWDVANAVLFLCANETSYITGQTITIDGGMVMN